MGYVAGIDEAGRGPVIGPMVMAIAGCKTEEFSRLERVGVKDSKLLTPQKRDELFEVMSELSHEIISLSPQEIDAAVNGKSHGDNLNQLEARTTALLIFNLSKRIELDKVIIDSPTKTVSKHENDVRSYLGRLDPQGKTKHIKLQCEIKADYNYVIVGAASILAKVTRDRAIASLVKIHGPLGSGYPADPYTQSYLDKHWQEGHDFFRKSWESYARLARASKEPAQSSLDSFANEQDTAAKHDAQIKTFEVLKEHGFAFVPPTNSYEVVRMKNAAGITIISYTTGKLLVQGNGTAATEQLLKKLNLAPLNIDPKRSRGRPKKS